MKLVDGNKAGFRSRRKGCHYILALCLCFTLGITACGETRFDLQELVDLVGNGKGQLTHKPTPTFTPFQPHMEPMEGVDNLSIATPESPNTPLLQESNQLPLVTTALPEQFFLWVDPVLPESLQQNINLSPEMLVGEKTNAHLHLQVGVERPISSWIYALVAPFPTLVQGVTLQDLQQTWTGVPAGPFAGHPLLMDESTLGVFSDLWGEPSPNLVRVLPVDLLLEQAWNERGSWALLPFDSLEPRWRVIEVDRQSPLNKDFDPVSYALTVPISLGGNETWVDHIFQTYGPGAGSPILPASNLDPMRMTVLVTTGVTALVRATAYTMEQSGLLYPGIDIREIVIQADLAHISNEVPFADNCPFPDPVQQDLRFCSDPRYIALLENVGTDIVELTGDHLADWDTQAILDTLEMYRERGWLYYGGGVNLAEARQALLIEHNGNRLAFIGCNAKGAGFAQARDDNPGAAPCDMDWMMAEVGRLRADGYLPVVTFQHYEYYTYQAQPQQVRDFGAMARAGAVIVSGSQAHQPQALAFESGALIHYGLGNLFFDQYEISLATRQAFIDRHIFYAGRHISTQLLPILFIDYARPRPMLPAESDELLQAIFQASGW